MSSRRVRSQWEGGETVGSLVNMQLIKDGGFISELSKLPITENKPSLARVYTCQASAVCHPPTGSDIVPLKAIPSAG